MDILFKACSFRLDTSKRILSAHWLLAEHCRRGKWVFSIILYFLGIVPVGSRYVQFGWQWYPIDKYKFDRPMRWSKGEGCRDFNTVSW